MPDMTIICPECAFPTLIPATVKSYDFIKCGNCSHPLNGEPVDVLERVGEWRRRMARDILDRQWEQYLDGTRGDFAQAIAQAFRLADSRNLAILSEAFPLVAAAYQVRT
jgi:hypothetical protein